MSQDKLFRQLVRVVDVDRDKGHFHVIVPGWDPEAKIYVSFCHLPEEMRNKIEPGERYHAQVNIGAKHRGELYFSGWEAEDEENEMISKSNKCVWERHPTNHEVYYTECGVGVRGIDEYDFIYCPYCSGEIVLRKPCLKKVNDS
ncbi:MAG: hypothetical protein ACOC5T_09560 [Elusimicrobiota bacterium]